MSSSVYQINKAANAPIVFRGLKAQWISWFCGGLLVLLLLFAICYIAGVPMLACLVIIAALGTLLFVYVYRFSKRYGEHGWMKEMSKRSTPKRIVCDQIFNP